MAKINVALPAKPSERHTILAFRENRLQWFTQKGWDLLSDRLEFGKQGQKVRVKKDGWNQVSPEDVLPAPAPLTADQVKPADSKTVKTVEGGDPNDAKKEPNEGDSQSGDAGEGGDQDQKKSDQKEKKAADSKSGKA